MVPAKKLPARSDIMDSLSISVQRLSQLWDYCAASPTESRTRKETLRRLSGLLDEMEPDLESLSDGGIIDVWRRAHPPDRCDTDSILMELAVILRQTSSILSIIHGRPPRGRGPKG